MKTQTILIAEDDVILGTTLKVFFEDNHYKVFHAVYGKEALEVYHKEKPSLLILDVELPDISGLEVLEKIRKSDTFTPVIIMTGSAIDEESQIKGIRNKIDHYLTKPVSPRVLLEYVNAILIPSDMHQFNYGRHAITIQNRCLTINGDLYKFKQKEAIVLLHFLRNNHLVVSRNTLLELIEEAENKRCNNILDNIIHVIRRMLKNYPGITIHNLYADGYRLEIERVLYSL